MSDGFRIRPAGNSDRDALLRLYQSAFPEKLITIKTWERITGEPATVWLAEVNASPSAFLYYWTVADEFQIIDIGTAPEFRRRGLAKTLLKKLIEKANVERKRIVLEARVGNAAAIALYESLGFNRTALRERYYGNGDDAALYELRPAAE